MMEEPGGSVILLYHGVTAAKSEGIENYSGKHMAAEEFERQMAWLADNARPMRLVEMAERLDAGEALPPRSVAVTFDDSYRNKAEVALPILKRHGIPATFFITTGFVGTDRIFWTDRVEHAVGRTDQAVLDIELIGGRQIFSLDGDGQRIEAINNLKRAMKLMSPADRDRVLAEIEEATGVRAGAESIENYHQLAWDEVRALDGDDGYEVGGHSVNHEVLSTLNEAELAAEIDGCLGSLEGQLGHPIRTFSYPEGQPEHYNDKVIAALKQRGIQVCPSAIHGVNGPGADPFHLRRIMVGFMGAVFPFPEYSN